MSESPTLSAVQIAADRVVLRRRRDADRERLIEMQTDQDVWAYLGGPSRREDIEQRLDTIGPATPPPGTFVIADKATDALIGTVQLNRRAADLPGHVVEEGGELELGYVLHRDAWGAGLAFEAATAVLRAAADELPDQPVILVTQSANQRSLKLAARLGFRPVGTFEQYDAEQTLAETNLYSFRNANRV
jgi:RimJ/RimL family protein N-acetyltransferase